MYSEFEDKTVLMSRKRLLSFKIMLIKLSLGIVMKELIYLFKSYGDLRSMGDDPLFQPVKKKY